MSEQITSCPQCASSDITTNGYQVKCRGCGWSLQDPDPRYIAHCEELGWANIAYSEPISEVIDALPANFPALLTTTRSALPANHPANISIYSLTGAEFRHRRETFGLSAEWLADRLGVALKTVQRWANGHRPIPEGVANELDVISTAIAEGAARPYAEYMITVEDAVMMIPRTGTYLGFPASWYRALAATVREVLQRDYGSVNWDFRVVYFDEVEDQS